MVDGATEDLLSTVENSSEIPPNSDQVRKAQTNEIGLLEIGHCVV